MSWWGKLIGGSLGFMAGGPIGALIGAALGHGFDRGLDEHEREPVIGFFHPQQRAQAAFFTATFSVMGHVAKADGRVSREEIDLASAVMDRFGLDAAQREVAQQLFRQGREPGFPLDAVLEQLRRECRGSTNLLRMFLEIQLGIAYADGSFDPAERRVIEHVAAVLGFAPQVLAELERLIAGSAGVTRTSGPTLAEARSILGVGADAEPAEIKRAYRRLMNRHHPDKLVARGLPEEMIAEATRKTQEIRAAYERLKEA